MQTHFDLTVLARPEIRTADEILRKCVHCGFCTATCPTYVLTGDERDSPRGRIWMMRDLLGGGDTQTKIKHSDISHHLDRCLTCLSCMTTCPSGVDYMHLVDIGRAEIEKQENDHGRTGCFGTCCPSQSPMHPAFIWHYGLRGWPNHLPRCCLTDEGNGGSGASTPQVR